MYINLHTMKSNRNQCVAKEIKTNCRIGSEDDEVEAEDAKSNGMKI